jgi:hypothetical protein
MTALMAMAVLFCGAAGAQDLPPPDQSFVSGKDLVVSPPDRGPSSFRYLPGGSYIPFDRSLRLSAAPGESRVYLIQIAAGKDGEANPTVVRYAIDKRRPGAPKAEPGTGLYSGAIRPSLSGDEGADIFWALIGPDGAMPSFSRYDEASRPSLAPPSAGTETYTLLAYAVDKSGNRGYPARFVYRLAETGLPAAAPGADSSTIVVDASIPRPIVDQERGFSALKMALTPGASLLVDVNPDSPPASVGDFEQVDPDGGFATLRVPCPYAWSEDLKIYYGLMKDGIASYNPEPVSVHISNPPDELAAPAAPDAPIVSTDPAGRGAFAVFPSYDGALYISVEGSAPVLYADPIPLPPGKPSTTISWYGEDDTGRRSAQRSRIFPLPLSVPDIALAGIADGAIIGGGVTLKPLAKGTLRYELRLDGSMPPEPGSSSPLVGESLSIPCPSGQELSVVLRYRAFAGDAAGEGRILRFTLDRKPPEAPRPSAPAAAYSDRPVEISLEPGQGAKDLFASVSVDGEDAPFASVTGPLALAGSDLGPVSYVVRAYDVDIAGNRSQEMKSLSIVVDRSSVYVADDGSDKGDGSPDRPYRSFDAAIAAAIKEGKRNVNMRGSFEMLVPVQASTEIDLDGGFGKLWTKDSSARAVLSVAIPRSQTAFTQRGGTLILRRVDVSVDSAGPGPFISVGGASLAIENGSISAGADGDFVLVSADRSRIDLKDSTIAASRAMAFTAFSSDGSDISVAGSSISAARGVRIFGAFDMDGGALSLQESLLASGADLGLSLLSLRSSSLLVDRSLIRADGGSGFLRLGSFETVKGEVKNSEVFISWNGPGVLFEQSGGGPAFRFDTIVAATAKGGLRFFDSSGTPPQVWNSILECSGQGSELLRSDSAPGSGVLVADCVWGFDKVLAGASEAGDIAALNGLNAGSALYSSKPIVSEPPERSFAAPLKSQASLRADSACVNGALPLEGGYEVDFSGHPRPGLPAPGKSGPDIGADELDG